MRRREPGDPDRQPAESDDTTAVVALVVASGLAITNTRRGVEKETAMRSKPPSARKGGAGAAAAPDGAAEDAGENSHADGATNVAPRDPKSAL